MFNSLWSASRVKVLAKRLVVLSSGDENEFNSVVAQRMLRGRGWGSRHKFTNDNFAFHESTNK